ncbi:MAG: ABC transporter ATP-binding protein [Gammaproteobacteria bacterium]|nr:ABC transporter ATP-binding protein [Gammaproteobacteria bacterium]
MTAALTIDSLHKTYKESFEALKGVSFEVEEGDFFALLGPNGAGKTTLIGILCSLVTKTSGQVQIFDADIDCQFAKAKSYMGVVPQEFNFSPFEKVFNIVMNQAGYYGVPKKLAGERAEHYLKQLGLWEKRDQISHTLSGGMKRRLMIVSALLHQPKLLILDEPTAGVDIELRRSLWDFLQEINRQGTTIILTTHYLEEAESLCRTVAIINHGKIVEYAKTAELLKQLDCDRFVLDVDQSLPSDLQLEGFVSKRINNFSLEVHVFRHQSINQLFTQLSQRNINIRSLRNKTNRLEELFLHLTQDEDEQE